MRRFLIGVLALGLGACGPGTEAGPGNESPKPHDASAQVSPGGAAAANAATLKATTITAADSSNQSAESVARTIALHRGDARLYSTVGGDPAINGEYVFLSVYGDPAEGSKTYLIGDFNSWDLVLQTADKIVLKVSHSAVEEPSGEIVTAQQSIEVSVPSLGADEITLKPLD